MAPALHAACKKIDEYYEKTTESPAYVNGYELLPSLGHSLTDGHASIALNPKEKLEYFKKHWSVDLQEAVATCVEDVVCANYLLPILELIQFRSRSSGYH